MAKKQAEKPKEISIDDKIREFVAKMKAKRSPFATDEEAIVLANMAIMVCLLALLPQMSVMACKWHNL